APSDQARRESTLPRAVTAPSDQARRNHGLPLAVTAPSDQARNRQGGIGLAAFRVYTHSQGEIVLEITRGAADLLTELRQGQEVPEDYGLRVFPETTQPGEVTIGLGFTD